MYFFSFEIGHHYVGAGNWIWVFSKSTKCSQRLSHLSSPFFICSQSENWQKPSWHFGGWGRRVVMSSRPAWVVNVRPHFKNLPTMTTGITQALFVTLGTGLHFFRWEAMDCCFPSLHRDLFIFNLNIIIISFPPSNPSLVSLYALSNSWLSKWTNVWTHPAGSVERYLCDCVYDWPLGVG